jgi:hypothetical protein
MNPPHGIDAKSLDSPDATWTFLDESARGVVNLGRVAVGRGNYRPGWRWSLHVQPLSGKESAEHIGYVISGRMRVRAKDGTEVESAQEKRSSPLRATMHGLSATSLASLSTSSPCSNGSAIERADELALPKVDL